MPMSTAIALWKAAGVKISRGLMSLATKSKMTLPAFFDSCAGGGVCPTCEHAGLQPLDDAVCGFIDRLLNLNWQQPPAFKVTGAVLLQAEKILIEFIAHRLERPLKSIRFIQMMKGTERLEER